MKKFEEEFFLFPPSQRENKSEGRSSDGERCGKE